MIEVDFLRVIERESHALRATIAAGPDRPIAFYPSWTILDLVAHTGGVHRWVAGMVRHGARRPPARPPHVDRDPARLADWFDDGVAMVVDALRRSRPDRPVWTMATDQTAGFWRRRMAHETAAHRWDAEHAIGVPRPIDPGVAATGIAETLEIHVVRPLAGARVGGRGERVKLRPLDVPGAWVVTLHRDRVSVDATDGLADVTISGSASSVWLNLMGRRVADVETTGDEPTLARFRDALRLADPPSH